MTRLRAVSLASVAVILGGSLGVLSIAPAGASVPRAASPRIVAHPDSVMVNSSTKLVGTNFKPKSTLTIKECSQSSWSVPLNPCDSTNSIRVRTNHLGQFTSSFTVQTCPGGTTTSPGFSETCYIGDPMPSGIDVINLVGAAKITVTGP
jgi:hypothetical protein